MGRAVRHTECRIWDSEPGKSRWQPRFAMFVGGGETG
ncbi:hypothetical protein CI41S_23360 [Bradyrhizobium ivorense]|nr:hypothetical protein CI41S_23360 [Bradyrhizobium ivorense]